MSATEALGEGIRSRLDEVQSEISESENKLKSLKPERTALRKSLQEIEKVLGKSSSNGGSADSGEEIPMEKILEIVAQTTPDSPVQTAAIAEALGTRPIKIARKLKKLADDGKIKGDKTEGWAPLGSTVPAPPSLTPAA